MTFTTDDELLALCDQMIDGLLADRGSRFCKTDPENIKRFNEINHAFNELIHRFESNPKKIGPSGESYQCSLDDTTLVVRTKSLLVELVETVGRSWLLHIPARPDSDPDLLMCELMRRYKLKTE